MKPIYSGHHRDIKIVSIIERRRLDSGSFQIDYFASELALEVLRYSVIDPKVCQEVVVGRREPKEIRTGNSRKFLFLWT